MVNKIQKNGGVIRPGYYDNYRKGKEAERKFIFEPYKRIRSIERPIGAKKIIKRTLYASFLILAILGIVFLFFISAVKINEVYNKISGYTINEGSSKISEIYSRISSKNEIKIINAEILDSERNFISNIYNDINEKDEKWSVYLYPEEYLRLHFEKNLTNKNDITLFAKSFDNISSQIEVYAAGKERLVTRFGNINRENWYKVYLNSLASGESYDAFDLKILGNPISFDYATDPPSDCYNGIGSNPITICTCADLNKTRDNLTANYILQNDIDFSTDGGACPNWTSGAGWEPIGNSTAGYRFAGNFSGNNNTISGLFINRSGTNDIGLFGGVDKGNITNLGLVNVTIFGKTNVGGLVGSSWSTTRFIYNCYATGNINGTSYVGGLVGFFSYGIINNSYSNANVNGTSQVGGLVGWTYFKIYNSYATGNVNGTSSVGGLAGTCVEGGEIYNSFATGNVNGTGAGVGGLVGVGSSVPSCVLSNSYYNNHSGNPSVCVGDSSPAGCTAIQNNYPYFYNISNLPELNWSYPPWDSFCNISGYPPLQWQNITNTSNCVSYSVSSSDTSYPLFSSYWDNNASLVGSGTGLFNVTVANTNGTVWLQINGTNYTAGNLSASMYNVSIAGMLNGTYNYTWISWGNGSDKLFNNSALRYYVVNATDTSYPQFSNFISQPVNASNYINGQVYRFNTTVTNTNGTIGLEFNGVNYTATNSSNNFTATINNLDAGTYSYYWWGYGNGTNKNFNASQIYSYTINKSIPQGNLTNTTSWTITYPTSVTIGLEESNLGDADVTYKVYRNTTDLGAGETRVLGVGYYSYALNTTGGANYSANSSMDSRILQVQQNSTYNFTIVGTTPISYGTSAGISNSSCPSQIVCNLYRNDSGTALTSPDNSILSAGFYNYTFNSSGNANYSARSTSFVLEVQGNATSCSIQFNTTSPKTYPYKFKVFTNCTSAFTLTRNGTGISNNSEQDLSAGWYNFSVVRSDTQNYTNVRDSQDFQIAQATPVITKLLNGGTANLTITYPQQSNATGSSTGGTIKIYRDETDVTTENALNVSLSAGTYNYKFNVTGNANYSGLTGEYMNLTIYKAGSPLVITIIPSTSVTSGTETNATGTGCPAGVICNLSRNDTGLVSNPNVQTLAVGYYNYTFNTSGNTNYSSNSTSVILNVTLDTIYPLFSNNETNPANNTQYTPNGIWRFNITITNTNGTAGIDFNGLNYSMSNSSAVFNKTFVNLGGGTYPYYFWAYGNGTNKNFNNSITYSYTIARNSSAVVYTYLNHSRANISIERGNYLWLNATRQTGEGNVKLYNNGNLINTGTNIGNYTLFNSAGIFNITSIYEATQNYSYSNETWWVNVSDSTAPAISIIYPLNITYNTNVSYINYSVNEDGNCWYSNSSGAWNSSSVSAGTNFSGVITKEGSNTFIVYCNDTTGNVNKTNITFIKDTIYPQFSNYTDNTGNLTGTGIAVFNFSIENTNGTVFLYINGNNYTATNLSANVFNVSVSLPAGSYSYYWISWGNGSLNNMNVSATINYVINSAADGSSGGGGSSGGSASCIYNWSCGNWGMCLNGIETRTCINKGNCIGNNGKPEEKRNCIENETVKNESKENLNESLENPAGGGNCGEWGRCRAVYSLNDLIEKRIILKGEQERICRGEVNLIERRECDTRIPIKTKKVNWCNGNYTEVYDLNESLISRLELTKEIFNVLNIDFEFNQSGYCNYCNNGIKDPGEDEVDCSYEENGSCPACSERLLKKRGLDLCWILFLISIGVLFWLLLKMKKKLCFFSQFFKLSIYDFIVDR